MSKKQIVKGNDLSSPSTTQVVPVSRQSAPPFVPESAATPAIECVKEGDIVRSINIRCACGQSTRLVCDYGDMTAPRPTKQGETSQ